MKTACNIKASAEAQKKKNKSKSKTKWNIWCTYSMFVYFFELKHLDFKHGNSPVKLLWASFLMEQQC
jgi:hypothetical protein